MLEVQGFFKLIHIWTVHQMSLCLHKLIARGKNLRIVKIRAWQASFPWNSPLRLALSLSLCIFLHATSNQPKVQTSSPDHALNLRELQDVGTGSQQHHHKLDQHGQSVGRAGRNGLGESVHFQVVKLRNGTTFTAAGVMVGIVSSPRRRCQQVGNARGGDRQQRALPMLFLLL